MRHLVLLLATLTAASAHAADYPTSQPGNWIAHDFRFHTGETFPELKLHYVTVGDPHGQPVLIIHGTGGSSASMLTPAYAGVLFGPGEPLDATKYFIILPDTIGAGGSTKPSDGLRTKFPHYDYTDMVQAEYRLITEGLGIHHLRLVTGNSMGGMQTWMWGEMYPGFMDALVPMASQPTAMASRNWMMRRLMVETIQHDPEYDNGNYSAQPPLMRYIVTMFGVATSGGTLAWQARTGTHARTDALVDELLAAPTPKDANDFVYQWASSADYDPAPMLERIEAPVLAINSADDERNPTETGVMQNALTHIHDARLYLIPASIDTRGHGTTSMAKFYAAQLADFLAKAPQRTNP